MQDRDRKALSDARIEHAEECLSSAKELYAHGEYKSAANRSYYAVFHAMRAVLAFDDVDMKHHSGIMAEFRRRYVKTGAFEIRYSDIISALFEIKTDSDYDDFFVISKEEITLQIANAGDFLDKTKAYLKTK